MDVDRSSFPVMLPTILKHIANSHFVAFDLELSGIPTSRRQQTDGKQTLAQRYTELKEAAETFHILQVGLTIVEEDAQNRKYLTRAFNFNLSPLIYEGLEIDRNFTYSNGAVEFLMNHNYRMDSPFLLGIPYLTKEETKLARERAILRWDKDAIPDIRIRDDDVGAKTFIKRVRKEVDRWKKTSKLGAEYYNVAGLPSPTSTEPNRVIPMNRFEKRLVHQVIRAEYPELQSFSRTDYVQVQPKDESEQKEIKESLQHRLAYSIFTQVGFRWIMEAIAGGDLIGLEPALCYPIKSEPAAANRHSFAQRIDEIKSACAQRKKILVGHNCLLDLVYIYRYFYGSLPDTVEEFKEALHAIFPTIIDTKYMATEGPDGHMFRSSQLWQIEEALLAEKSPIVDTPSDHPEYIDTEKYHEAGFDSFVTATVFLKLAAKFEAASRDEDETAGGVPLPSSNATENEILSGQLHVITNPNSVVDVSAAALQTKKTKMKKKTKVNCTKEPSKGLFRSNMYEELSKLAQEPTLYITENPASSSSAVDPDMNPPPREGMALLTIQDVHVNNVSRTGLIPNWNTDFWRVYGNRLRVYGTMEEVCDLVQKGKD